MPRVQFANLEIEALQARLTAIETALIELRMLIPGSEWLAVDTISDEELRLAVARYEREYGMTSAQFIERWQNYDAPDTFDTNSWAMLIHAFGLEFFQPLTPPEYIECDECHRTDMGYQGTDEDGLLEYKCEWCGNSHLFEMSDFR